MNSRTRIPAPLVALVAAASIASILPSVKSFASAPLEARSVATTRTSGAGLDPLRGVRFGASRATIEAGARGHLPRLHGASGRPATISAGVSDGVGGLYVVYDQFVPASSFGLSASVGAQLALVENHILRVRSTGDVAPGWPAEGIAPATGPANTSTTLLVTDASGGVIVVWDEVMSFELRIHAQRLDSTGVRQWGPGGVLVASGVGYRYLEAAISDGAGGVLIGWQESGLDPTDGEADLMVQRLTSAGAVASGWSGGGVELCFAPGNQQGVHLAPDGTGGLIACWSDARVGSDNYIQRVDGSGTPQWEPDGISVGTLPPADIASDGAAGAIVCSINQGRVVAQRYDASGAPLWGVSGVDVTTSADPVTDPLVAYDGEGGALVHWISTPPSYSSNVGTLLAKRLTSTGATQAGWLEDGLFVGDSLATFGSSSHDAIRDGTGGFLFAWTDWRAGTAVFWTGDTIQSVLCHPRAQRVTGAGATSPVWPGSGVRVSGDQAFLTDGRVTFAGDGAGGGSFAWKDWRPGPGLYGQRLDGTGVKQWNAADVRLVAEPDGQGTPAIGYDGAGGALVAWMESPPRPSTAYARRIDASGALASPKTPLGPPRGPLSTLTASDGSGGTFFAWHGSPSGIHVQHFDAAGAARWDTAAVADPTGTLLVGLEGMSSDGQGGIFLLWLDSDYVPKIQRFDSEGHPMWSPVVLFGPDEYVSFLGGALVPDGAGGAVAVQQRLSDFLNLYAQRVDADGNLQWGASGAAVAGGSRDQQFVRATSDGAGGVIVTWTQDLLVNDDVWAARVDGTGNIATGWPAAGVRVCGAPGRQLLSDIVGDGVGGCVVAWTDARGSTAQVYAQALSSAGAPRWTADGVALGPGSGAQYLQQLVPDGTGGAIASWIDARGPVWGLRAQRVKDVGSLTWGPGGLDVGGTAPSPLPVVTGTPAPGNQLSPVLAPDGLGGALVAWQELATPFDLEVRAQKITGDGTLAWSVGGVTSALASFVSTAATPGLVRLEWWSSTGLPTRLDRRRGSGDWSPLASVVPDGEGVCVFEDRDVVAGERYGYRVVLPSATGESVADEVWLTIPSAAALAFAGALLNPVRGDVSLAFGLRGGSTAWLEVFDLSGRRLIARDVRALGAGAHRLRVASAGELRPGVYLARLTEGRESRLGRFTVIH